MMMSGKGEKATPEEAEGLLSKSSQASSPTAEQPPLDLESQENNGGGPTDKLSDEMDAGGNPPSPSEEELPTEPTVEAGEVKV